MAAYGATTEEEQGDGNPLGQIAPDFDQDSTEGRISFHKWLGNSWGVLFSHPKGYTPVCTTELAEVARLKPEWEKRHVKPIGLSVDSASSHKGWEKDIEENAGAEAELPCPGGCRSHGLRPLRHGPS